MTTIDELYCNIADFNQFFYPEWEKTLLESGDKKRRRQAKSRSEARYDNLLLIAALVQFFYGVFIGMIFRN